MTKVPATRTPEVAESPAMPEARLAHEFLDGTPAGLPRPRIDGMPVPWITRMDGKQAAWARVIPHRLRECQRHWLCQVCGQALSERAWVLAEYDLEVLSGAAMHLPCLRMAQHWCPHIKASQNLTVVEVSMAEIDEVKTLAGLQDGVADWVLYETGSTSPDRQEKGA